MTLHEWLTLILNSIFLLSGGIALYIRFAVLIKTLHKDVLVIQKEIDVFKTYVMAEIKDVKDRLLMHELLPGHPATLEWKKDLKDLLREHHTEILDRLSFIEKNYLLGKKS